MRMVMMTVSDDYVEEEEEREKREEEREAIRELEKLVFF